MKVFTVMEIKVRHMSEQVPKIEYYGNLLFVHFTLDIIILSLKYYFTKVSLDTDRLKLIKNVCLDNNIIRPLWNGYSPGVFRGAYDSH